VDEREAILGDMWTELIRPNGDLERVRRLPEAARLLEAGADPGALTRLLQLVAYEAVFGTLFVVTQPEASGLLGLHEDLLSSDPTGQEGADFLGG